MSLVKFKCPTCGREVSAIAGASLVFHPCPAKDRRHVDLKRKAS